MKKTKRNKGFTLVELVIVIAVIAILAAVLIPTFVTVIDNANESAALQEATELKTEILALYEGNFDNYCTKQVESSSTTRDITESLDTAPIDKNDTAKDAPKFADFITVKEIKTGGADDDWSGIKITAPTGDNGGKIEYKTGSFYVTINAKSVDVTKTKPVG